jgi:cytochrome c oxidase subunit IV
MTNQQTPHTQQHPVGTLVIVGVYGLLLVLGWLAIYFFIFRERGLVRP